MTENQQRYVNGISKVLEECLSHHLFEPNTPETRLAIQRTINRTLEWSQPERFHLSAHNITAHTDETRPDVVNINMVVHDVPQEIVMNIIIDETGANTVTTRRRIAGTEIYIDENNNAIMGDSGSVQLQHGETSKNKTSPSVG